MPKKTLGAVAQAAQAAGVACEVVQVAHEHAYQAIIDTAVSKGCDLIVMASHGRHGISAIVLGSETVIYDDEMDQAYWPHEFSALCTVSMAEGNLWVAS